MIAVAVTVIKFFSLSFFIPNNSFAASRHVSGSVGAIIAGTSSALTLSTLKPFATVARSGAPPTRVIKNSTGTLILKPPCVIANSSRFVTSAAASGFL